MGLRLNLKWDFPIHSHSHSLPTSPFKLPPPPSSHVRGRDTSFSGTRWLFLPVTSEGDNSHREPLTANASSSAAPQTLDSEFLGLRDVQINKRSYSGLRTMIEDNLTHARETMSSSQPIFQPSKPAQFNLLMENLNILEDTFANSDMLRSFRASNVLDLYSVPTRNSTKDEHVGRTFVRSAKKDERKSRRERVLENGKKLSSLSLTTKIKGKAPQQPSVSSAKRVSHSRSSRRMIDKNQAEMARGIKVITDLERIRTTLEEETGQIARLSQWAEAAGLDQKVLQQQLHFGWQCRDEILRSTRPLVMYLLRYYRGPGVAFEDLLQAGNLGVLEGAKMFDPDKGCKFSTYIQYWIRKSMSAMATRCKRDVHIPTKLSQVLYQIRRAERALKNGHNYPENAEIAKFTGISLARIELAMRWPRVVGSTDQKVGDDHNVNILDITPDTSLPRPEEIAMREHMERDIHDLINGLDPKESRVLILRFGFDDHKPKSLEETGKLCRVSKEWIRQLEKKAMKKLRGQETAKNLKHYMMYIM
uniref:Sigma factor n=1 Tax=Geranium maderense TaxID=28964 RepID=A0A0G2STT5_9ROSI|nr:sigma factor [Geranium maderense]